VTDLAVHFPPVPRFSAYWAPIYLEPMLGSGERLTAVVACLSEDGQLGVELAVRARVLKCMYGDHGERVLGMAKLVRDSLQEHLALGGAFDTWLSPSPSCHLGPVRIALGDNVESILTKAAKLTASTSGVELDVEEAPETTGAGPDVDTWLEHIRDVVAARNQSLVSRFNCDFKSSPGAMATRIGFLGDRIAANFDALVPGSNFSGKRSRSKARLLDLLILRDMDLFVRQSYELMLWVPQRGSPAFSERAVDHAYGALLELEEFGDKHMLRVQGLHTANQAAERLLKVELD
jgi:hypothetical protein